MPSPTYTLISETVLGSGQLSVTFSSIPSTYKDLIVEVIGNSEQAGSGGNGLRMRINSDTGTNYSYTGVYGDGTSAASYRGTTSDFLDIGILAQTSASPAANVIHIMSYANTSINKTLLSRYGMASVATYAVVGLWRSTSAINSVQLYRDLTNNLKTGFTARLWGVVG